MNNLERELKLQAYLDGELNAADAAEVERWLDEDAQVAALSAELKQTKAALSVGEVEVKCPETREFYWSKIARSIEAEERQSARAKTHEVPWWRKLMLPVGALAALAVTLLTIQTAPEQPHSKRSDLTKKIDQVITEVEQVDDTMGAITYNNNSEGVTVVWHYDRSGDI